MLESWLMMVDDCGVLHLIGDARLELGGAQRVLHILLRNNDYYFSFANSSFSTENVSAIDSIARLIISLRNIDVVVVHSRIWLLLVPVLKLLRKKIVFYSHVEYKRKKLIFKIFGCDAYVFVSHVARKSISKWVPSSAAYKIINNPLLVNVNNTDIVDKWKSESQDNASENDIRCSVIAGLYRWKGVDKLLHTVGLVAETLGRKAYIDIVGDGPLLEELGDINYKGLKVILHGYNETPFKVVRKSKILVIPSLEEGFCMVALEAMAQGFIIIYNDIEQLSTLLANDKYSIPFDITNILSLDMAFNDANKIVRKISVRDIDELLNRSINVRERYSISSTKHEYELLLQGLCSE